MVDTEIVAITETDALDRAVAILRDGGLVALPTDTVYGLGADAWNGKAVSSLYKVKSRSELKSIPVLLSGVEALSQVARTLGENVLTLAEEFWPGPLTMVIERKPDLPSEVSASPTVGVRAPDHPFTLGLLEAYGPLATTSANLSGRPNATTADQVLDALRGNVDLVLDGGETPGGIPSTVVDLTRGFPALLRQGPISMEAILAVWNDH